MIHLIILIFDHTRLFHFNYQNNFSFSLELISPIHPIFWKSQILLGLVVTILYFDKYKEYYILKLWNSFMKLFLKVGD